MKLVATSGPARWQMRCKPPAGEEQQTKQRPVCAGSSCRSCYQCKATCEPWVQRANPCQNYADHAESVATGRAAPILCTRSCVLVVKRLRRSRTRLEEEQKDTSEATKEPKLSVSSIASVAAVSVSETFGSSQGSALLQGTAISTTLRSMAPAPRTVSSCGSSCKG